ncbi:hypothetical protein FD03_GL000584 [Companilactobacillus nodensis DSM 19682 = JCM 14932 = NBRC 107160]|uniref:Phage head-tail adaptor n=2 Tax=Companilactobacillus nodensis TaxID=460870 RepID=A0A0R1K714_9LACO|nr:hypothetical protein FD03_GL000584 [Companilactobacillus nodensis DSM 19682 = JCM 14932 = NBRC 107160]
MELLGGIMMKRKLSNFNDGVLHYGTIKTKRNALKEKVGLEFVESGFLFFDFKQIRQEDTEIYDIGKDQTSNLKVQTYYIDGIDKNIQKVVYKNDYYEVKNIDPSNDRKTMFWYLTKKGSLNEIQ